MKINYKLIFCSLFGYICIINPAYSSEYMCSPQELGETILAVNENEFCTIATKNKDTVRMDLCSREKQYKKINGKWKGSWFSFSYDIRQGYVDFYYVDIFKDRTKQNCNNLIDRVKRFFGAYWGNNIDLKATENGLLEIYFQSVLMGTQKIDYYPDLDIHYRNAELKKPLKGERYSLPPE